MNILRRIITDRYALPQGADPTACDPAKQTWCGGTWNTIKDNLDYIQNAGFTASTFSPVGVCDLLSNARAAASYSLD